MRYATLFTNRKGNVAKPPFDPSLMVYFRKRLTAGVLVEINEMIITKAQPQQEKKNGDDDQDSGNGGTMIIDATCAPSNIRYPQDTSLLNEARESAEKIIDVLHTPGVSVKPRTYRKKAHKEYLKFARHRKRSASFIRKAIRIQLGYLSRDLSHIDTMLAAERFSARSCRLDWMSSKKYTNSKSTCTTKEHTPLKIELLV